MPTATLTLNSADIAGDPVNVSKTSTCYKAGTTTPLDETTGLNKIILTTTTNKELYIATAGGNDKSAKMYICNKSTTPSEYVTITINAQDIGKLYAGDWMFIPWSQTDTSAQLEIQASVATAMPIEYMLMHEGYDLADA
tara:strand:+ start:1031 stop:1447 length:417 start_codon:yes stop_codon:yes gene_type:complete